MLLKTRQIMEQSHHVIDSKGDSLELRIERRDIGGRVRLALLDIKVCE
jgi:hypothetical protein